MWITWSFSLYYLLFPLIFSHLIMFTGTTYFWWTARHWVSEYKGLDGAIALQKGFKFLPAAEDLDVAGEVLMLNFKLAFSSQPLSVRHCSFEGSTELPGCLPGSLLLGWSWTLGFYLPGTRRTKAVLNYLSSQQQTSAEVLQVHLHAS